MKDLEVVRQSCTCTSCVDACSFKPGWFAPGEIEKVAKYLHISVQELFDSKLSVDWYEAYPHDVFVIAPAVVGGNAGDMYDYHPKGTCVFLTDDDRCSIHAVKPHECRMLIHDEPPGDRHEQVASAWAAHQQQIADLLGREPVATEPPEDWSPFSLWT